jgi:hypothetical protein
VRHLVQAFDAVLRDVVLGDAEDVADLDAGAYLGAGPVVCLLEHPEEALEDSWSEEGLTRLGRSPPLVLTPLDRSRWHRARLPAR